jgi:hypothetical protein
MVHIKNMCFSNFYQIYGNFYGTFRILEHSLIHNFRVLDVAAIQLGQTGSRKESLGTGKIPYTPYLCLARWPEGKKLSSYSVATTPQRWKNNQVFSRATKRIMSPNKLFLNPRSAFEFQNNNIQCQKSNKHFLIYSYQHACERAIFLFSPDSPAKV